MYFACIYLLWKSCPALRPYRALVSLCAIAYPPLFHFFVRGQLSAAVLLCFTAAVWRSSQAATGSRALHLASLFSSHSSLSPCHSC